MSIIILFLFLYLLLLLKLLLELDDVLQPNLCLIVDYKLIVVENAVP